jgi:AraC-like DNA-binding protein
MAELVRVAALTGYFQTMESLGADPTPLLREVGLTRSLLSDSEQMISAMAAVTLLERSAEVSQCRTFGLRMSPIRGLADLGATSLLIEHEPTLRDVLAALSRNRDRINPVLMLHIEDFGEGILIHQNLMVSGANASRQANDLALSALARLCHLVMGDQWHPELVRFTCEEPSPSELPIYRSLFDCPVEFGAESNGIVVAYRDLDRPSQRADSALAEHARKLIEAAMGPARQRLSQQVEHSLVLSLPSGRATIQSCSALLGVTVRTLQRGLDAENTSFSSLLNRARIRLANEYFGNPETSISNIAGMLGYRSLSSFTRWHQQTYGMAPKARRKRDCAETDRIVVSGGTNKQVGGT